MTNIDDMDGLKRELKYTMPFPKMPMIKTLKMAETEMYVSISHDLAHKMSPRIFSEFPMNYTVEEICEHIMLTWIDNPLKAVINMEDLVNEFIQDFNHDVEMMMPGEDYPERILKHYVKPFTA